MQRIITNYWPLPVIILAVIGIIYFGLNDPEAYIRYLVEGYTNSMMRFGNPAFLILFNMVFINKKNWRRLPQLSLAFCTGGYGTVYTGFVLDNLWQQFKYKEYLPVIYYACMIVVWLPFLVSIIYAIIKKKCPSRTLLYLTLFPPVSLLCTEFSYNASDISELLILPFAIIWYNILIKEIKKLIIKQLQRVPMRSSTKFFITIRNFSTWILRWGTVMTILFFIIVLILTYLLPNNEELQGPEWYMILSIPLLLCSALLIYWSITLPDRKRSMKKLS